MNLRNLIDEFKSKGNQGPQSNNQASAENGQESQRFINNSSGTKKVFHIQGKKQNQVHNQNNFLKKKNSVNQPSISNKSTALGLEVKKHQSMREPPKSVEKTSASKIGQNQANTSQNNPRPGFQQNHSKQPSARSDTVEGGPTKNSNPTDCDVQFMNWIKHRKNHAPEKEGSPMPVRNNDDFVKIEARVVEAKLRTSETNQRPINKEEKKSGKMESPDHKRYRITSRSKSRSRRHRVSKSRSRSTPHHHHHLRRSAKVEKYSHTPIKPVMERLVSQSQPKSVVVQRQNGKPTFRQQLQEQIQSEAQSYIESNPWQAQLNNDATTENNYNNKQKQIQNKDEQMIIDHDYAKRKRRAVNGHPNIIISSDSDENIDKQFVQKSVKPERINNEDVPFYIKEKQERERAINEAVKESQKRKLALNDISVNTHLKDQRIQAHFKILEMFLEIAKVVLNRFQKRIVNDIKAEYVRLIDSNKSQLKSYTESISVLAKETQILFQEAVKRIMNQNQYTSIKHCLMRIYKACQIQLDDFVWKNGPYRESSFATGPSNDKVHSYYSPFYYEIPENFYNNEGVLKQRTQLLAELIEIEQVSKQYIDLLNRNFYQLWDQCKSRVISTLDLQKIKQQYSRFSNYKEFVAQPLKFDNGIHKSLIDIFTQEEINKFKPQYTFVIFLLETGNTIDGVTIASKILCQERFNQSLAHNFQVYLNWKKRKCHCCMEFILDAGKAVTCINLTRENDPCNNLYCQNCVIAFMDEKHHFEDDDNSGTKSQRYLEGKTNREREDRKIKHKLWLKALQNILFVCPCCQGYCLNEDNSNLRELNFSKFSICNFNYKLLNHPRSFMKRDVYWYRVQGMKKLFYLAKFRGIDMKKQLHKIEVLQTSQTFQIKLSKEEIFFTNTVKPGSKLFKIIDQQGTELDLRAQLEKQIKDFTNFKTYPILERFVNFLEKQEGYMDGFHIPKFEIKTSQFRIEFLKCHRDLYRRQDYQIFDTFDYPIETCFKIGQSSCQTSLKSENQAMQEPEVQSLSERNALSSNEKMPFEIQRRAQQFSKPRQPLDHVDKRRPYYVVSSQPINYPENPLKNIDINQDQQNIGMLMTNAKNIELAKSLSGSADNFNLLIHKDIFKIDKNEMHTGMAKQPMDAQMAKNWVKNMEERERIQQQQDFYVEEEQSTEQVDMIDAPDSYQLSIQDKETPEKYKKTTETPSPKQIPTGKRDDKDSDSYQELIDSKQTRGRKRGYGSMRKDKNKTYAELIKELRNGERKEYNLRRSGNSGSNNWWMQQNIKHVTRNRELKNLRKFDLKLDKEKSPDAYNDDDYYVQRNLRERKDAKIIEEGFFDDFPVELIKKYKLKVSSNFKKKMQEDRRRNRANKKLESSTGQQSEMQQSEKPEFQSTPVEHTQKVSMRGDMLSEQSQKSTQKQENQKVPPYKQRFKMTDKLQQLCDKFHHQVVNTPEKLLGLTIYMYREDKGFWRRAKLRKLISEMKEQKRIFSVELQDTSKKVIRVNLEPVKFFVDKSTPSETASAQPQSSQDQIGKPAPAPVDQNLSPTTLRQAKDEKKIQDQVDKLLKYPFNSKKRVSKLLDKVKASNSTPSATPPEEIHEEEEEKFEGQVIEEPSLEKAEEDEKAEESPKQELQKPPKLELEQKIELSPKPVLRQSPHIDVIEDEDDEEEPDDAADQKADDDIEPKEEWIKGMGIQLITKQGNTKNKKVLKFYTQVIQENELDSEDDQNFLIEQWKQTIQSQQLQIQQAEHLNQYFQQLQQQPPLFDPLDDQVDEQKLKIFKLMEQIKQQQIIKRQYDNFGQDQFLFNQYQQQLLLGYGFDDPLNMQYQLGTGGIHPQDISIQEMVPLTEEQIFNQLRVVGDGGENGKARDAGDVIEVAEVDEVAELGESLIKNALEQTNQDFPPKEKEIEDQLNLIQKQTEALKQNFIKEENLQQRIMKLKELQNFEQEQEESEDKDETLQEYDPENIPVAAIPVEEKPQFTNEEKEPEEEEEQEENWYLKQVQKSLDQLETIKMINNPEQAQEAFSALEDGMMILEQGYNEAKQIEDQIVEQMQIEQSFYSETEEQSVEDLYNNNHSYSSASFDQSREANLDYFADQISQIEMQLTSKKRKPISLKSKQIKKSRIQINPAFELDHAQFHKRKKKIMQNFYSKMIAHKGYKKCSCPACFKCVYPMLIRFDADSLSFLDAHQAFYTGAKQSDNLLYQLMGQKKTEKQLRLDIQVQQQRIRHLNNKQEHQDRLLNLFESYECERSYPLFGALAKKVNDEVAQEIEQSQRQNDMKLPKLSQIYLYNNQSKPLRSGYDEKFDLQLERLQSKMDARLNSDEQNTDSFDTDAYELEKQMLNDEFESIKQIQRHLRKLQLKKIETLRLKKLKYERQKHTLSNNGDKINALRDRANKLIN